ncbi:23S rRNA (cytidine1920-2'-O)/16S rRNA (cytidine1409-2'-O)-methyltransferase [Leucobacter komagatae]|uniref:23S rRNA (Cytidine1920-2'-O)/16S rRNA (Cytidine1409-2'-O)-methyltransferase n=1 Tax=Leucobacter komagatae TaxID=55969 RepID=A0A542Y990_9MICO|nr:23S rRNA (cytidine1920-2'-O)/16S rRNA (cytidine1409-2'-O)-methyltransferase [Leucobacter komagatae]
MRARSAVDTEGLWNGAPQRLDRVAVELGLVRSRSRAAELIGAGGIAIDGVPATKPGAKVTAGARVSVTGDDHYVSRGAHKLVAALDEFALDATGRLALDLGASTGGFTQVLLERGANTVLAVDVGHDQLAPELRGDDRVRVVEGCNARELDADMLAELTGVADRPSLVVADLSFISLTLILPAITRCTDDGADLALLIKPQFEVGRVRDGVVTDPGLWRDAIAKVLAAATSNRLAVRGLAPSPIAGGEGNREFLVHLVRGEPSDPREWDERIREVCEPGYTREEGTEE